MTRFYVPPDFAEESASWGANCGPVALSGMIGKPLAEIRPLVGDFKGYMNARDMIAAIRAAGHDGQLVKVEPTWRGIGLVRIQFEGPWTKPGVPAAAALKHTHWVGSCGPEHVLDVNFEPLRWDTWDVWEREIGPMLVAETPKATGWSIRDVIIRKAIHTCHAEGCKLPVPPAMFMCRSHWYALPKPLRDAVWRVYVPGQEKRKDPTDEYLRVSQEAIEWLAAKEGRRATAGGGA